MRPSAPAKPRRLPLMIVAGLFICTCLLITISIGYNLFTSPRSDREVIETVATAAEVGAISLGTGRVYDLAFAPDGQTLAAGTGNGVWLYDMAGGREPRQIPTTDIDKLAWSPDGTQIAMVRDGRVEIWSAQAGVMVVQSAATFILHGKMAWSPNGQWLAVPILSSTAEEEVWIFNPENGEVVLVTKEFNNIEGIAWSSDGDYLAISSHPREIKYSWSSPYVDAIEYDAMAVWDVANQREVVVAQHTTDQPPDPDSGGHFFYPANRIVQLQDNSLTIYKHPAGQNGPLAHTALAWSPDKQWLAQPRNEAVAVSVANTHDPDETRTFNSVETRFSVVAWSPDGQLLAAASDFNTYIHIWKWEDGELLETVGQGSGWLRYIAWSPDMQQIATVGQSGRIALWSVAEGRVIHNFARLSIGGSPIAWSPDGRFIAANGRIEATKEDYIDIWDATTGELHQSWAGRAYNLVWSPDGQALAGTQSGAVVVWNPVTTELINTFPIGSLLADLQWMPDSQTLIAVENRRVPGSELYTEAFIVWNVNAGAIIGELIAPYEETYPREIRLSPNGLYLATYLDDDDPATILLPEQRTVLWEVASQTLIYESPRMNGHGDGLAWSPTHPFLASYAGRNLAVYNSENKQMILLGGHHSTIEAVAWSPNGAWIATGSYDGSLILWPADAVRAYLPQAESE